MKNNTDYNRFYNCVITATSAPETTTNEATPPSYEAESVFYALAGLVATGSSAVNELKSSENMNWLVLRDCVINNLGLVGTMSVENCTFLLGYNMNRNKGMVRAFTHSRITNCLFDGKCSVSSSTLLPDFPGNRPIFPGGGGGSLIPGGGSQYPGGDLIPPTGEPIPLYYNHLTETGINLTNASDVVIDGCTFLAFRAKSNHTPELIRVDYQQTPVHQLVTAADLNNYVAPQNGVAINNCYFDLPAYNGYGISVLNLYTETEDNLVLGNCQSTMIDGNYLDMPKTLGFVFCPKFADNVTVKNNSGCVNKALVVAEANPGSSASETASRKQRTTIEGLHNFTIEGNILRYQKYDQSQVTDGMCILKGVSLNNLTLRNNTVFGAIWDINNELFSDYLLGTLRITDNESIGSPLFANMANNFVQSSANVFFSGNVSNGVKTDVGLLSVANSIFDGLKFIGRQFVDIGDFKLKIFDGVKWK